jgi:hypothetical protein
VVQLRAGSNIDIPHTGALVYQKENNISVTSSLTKWEKEKLCKSKINQNQQTKRKLFSFLFGPSFLREKGIPKKAFLVCVASFEV